MTGPQESKWYEQLRYRLTGEWSTAVVTERVNLALAILRNRHAYDITTKAAENQ